MTPVKQPYQELFDYLANELNVIALITQMQEIEAIIMRKKEQQIKDASNQGNRDALKINKNRDYTDDVSLHSEAENYFSGFKNRIKRIYQ